MALSHDLPIYLATMKLLSLTIEKTKCYPRFYRYTVGEKMVNSNLDMLSLIYRANSSYEKISILSEFLDKYNLITMLYRISIEHHVINERQYAAIALLLQQIGKQATSWKQYNEKCVGKKQ
jgi:hypothetical protein